MHAWPFRWTCVWHHLCKCHGYVCQCHDWLKQRDMMGSLGYAKCHWCKTEGWNFYIPDGVGGPLCGKCLLEEWEDKSTEHSAAAEDRMQHRWTESTGYTRQSNHRTGSTGRNLTPPTRSEPYLTDHVGNRRAVADPSDLSTGANKHIAATANRMPHQWTQGTLNTRQSNGRTRSIGRNLTPSTRSEPYPTDLAPDAKHQTWPQASDDQAKKMEEQKHQESYNFKRAKLDLQNTMRKAEAEYRTCWRCGHPITQVWWTTLLVSEAVLSRRPTCSSFCLLEYCSTIGNNWLLEVSLDKDRMMCQLDKLQKELLPPATLTPERLRNMATDTVPPESARRM